MEMPTGWVGVIWDVFNAVGILAFGISGALLAVQKRMDLVGMAGLAVVTGTGGGMTRDVLIGATPVAALVNWWMLVVALAGAVVVLAFHRWMSTLRRPVLIFDAIGLGIFVVDGAAKAMSYGIGPVGAAFAGMLTGIGGGILRDSLAMEIPSVFRRASRLYLLPALLGSSAAAAVIALGLSNWVVMVVIAALVVVVRIVSELRGWRVPSLSTQVIDVLRDRDQ